MRNPLIRGSELLYRFLSPDEEFSSMFAPDTVGKLAGNERQTLRFAGRRGTAYFFVLFW